MRNKKHSALVLAVVFLQAIVGISCHRTQAVADRAVAPHAFQNNELIEAPLKAIGKTRASVIATLGEPSSVAVIEVPNRHEPSRVDRVHTMTYSGITVQVYEVTAHGKDLLLSVRMTTNQPGLLPEIIGITAQDTTSRLGLPSIMAERGWSYRTTYEGGDEEDSMLLEFKNDIVESVEWHFYLD